MNPAINEIVEAAAAEWTGLDTITVSAPPPAWG
jgi:hypothetical protein